MHIRSVSRVRRSGRLRSPRRTSDERSGRLPGCVRRCQLGRGAAPAVRHERASARRGSHRSQEQFVAWRLRKGSHTTEAVHVAVEWTTSENLIDDTMGFAPLLTMPVPRRSPYVAIALWPGGQQNPLRGVPPTPPAKAGRVSFLDVPHGFDEETNASMWKTTAEKVAELMTLPADRPKLYRSAAFVLGASAIEGLAF